MLMMRALRHDETPHRQETNDISIAAKMRFMRIWRERQADWSSSQQISHESYLVGYRLVAEAWHSIHMHKVAAAAFFFSARQRLRYAIFTPLILMMPPSLRCCYDAFTPRRRCCFSPCHFLRRHFIAAAGASHDVSHMLLSCCRYD